MDPRSLRSIILWLSGIVASLIFMSVFVFSTNNASAQSVDDDRLESALLQSYFISVDNFAGPVMMGGMGVPLVPTMIPPDQIMVMMGQMGQMADFDPANMPANPGMLAAIYASAEPALVPGVTPDPMDFGTMRWGPRDLRHHHRYPRSGHADYEIRRVGQVLPQGVRRREHPVPHS